MTTPASRPDPVWYAAYGSNLDADRFRSYLTGAPTGERGARDPSPPSGWRAAVVDHGLAFGGHSRRWGGGGVAHLRPRPEPATATLVRLWAITLGQLEDVHAQENGRAAAEAIDLVRLGATRSYDTEGGRYRRLLHLGELEGRPVITFTSPEPLEPNPPGPDYLAVIARGVQATHGLSDAAARAYVARSVPAGADHRDRDRQKTV